MKTPTRVNRVIIESIPLKKGLKRFVLQRWSRLAEHSGIKYAADDFKKAREVLLAYRADTKRLANRPRWLREFPWHTNGWVRMLFDYMDSSPNTVLQLMKIYCGPGEPLVSVPEAVASQHDILLKAKNVSTRVPGVLREWLRFVTPVRTRRDLSLLYQHAKTGCGGNYLTRSAKSHDLERFIWYYHRWHTILCETPIVRDNDPELQSRLQNREPVPEMYADYDSVMARSESLEDDLWQLACMPDPPFQGFGPEAEPPLSSESYRYVLGLLNPNLQVMLMDDVNRDDLSNLQLGGKRKKSVIDGLYVGRIHHIPKKGTVKRRSIAVPNRFIQLGLVPADYQLELLLRRLPCDCTYDQGRFDMKISSRLARPKGSDLYVGCVDLSQATDHLPFNWMLEIEKAAFPLWRRVLEKEVTHSLVDSSWRLFQEVTLGCWDNDGYLDRWSVGQPLGTLPSFKCLAITHNIILEAIAFSLGMTHSPYAILGDDLIIFNKKVRGAYIRLMQNAHIPLSLHKSYEGNLVEFAGKIFVRNMAPFYNTDQAEITWQSLFDYQWSTGIYLPWGVLPENLKKRWRERMSAGLGKPVGLAVAARYYRAAFLSQLPPRGASTPQYTEEEKEAVTRLSIALIEDDPDEAPSPEYYSGIHLVGQHPITYLNYGEEDHGRWKRRFRRILPLWFRYKYRPVTTDHLAHCAGIASQDHKNPEDAQSARIEK